MNRFRKAISVGVTATMLASLLATVAAPAAFASLASTTGGNIVPGGAASAAFTLTFAEDSVTDFVDGSFTIAVADSANVDGNVFWVATSIPTVTRNSGVGGCTAGFVAVDLLSVNCDFDDPIAPEPLGTKLDSFTIGNLKVDSTVGAAKGAVIFAVGSDTVTLPEGLVPASGVVAAGTSPQGGPILGGTTANFLVTLDPGSPAFQVTGFDCDSATVLEASNVTVAASGIVIAESFAAVATTDGTQVTKATALTGDKPNGTAVTQNVCATRFPSAVTVGDAVELVIEGSTEGMQAGVNSQDGGNLRVRLGFFDGLLQDGDTVTFTITTPGVLFSPDSFIDVAGTNITAASRTLGAGRTTITITLDETGGDDAGTEGVISAGLADSLLFDPNYDVALGTASGTTVDVAVTVSRAGVTVLDSPITVATVGFIVAGSTAAPNVLIGQNDQATGMIVLRESAAGSMGDGEPTDNDLIEVCLEDDSDVEHWSVGRYFWAVVTVGDLKLNIGGLPVSQGQMKIGNPAVTPFVDETCLWINIYTESTVASTVEIRSGTATAPDASGPLNGPKVNIDNDAVPGPVVVDVYVDGTLVGDNIVIAVRAYSNTPIVTVTGQPTVVRGGLAQSIGSIIITEGAPNQFNDSDWDLCLQFPSVSDNGAYKWTTPVGVNQPVATSNSTVSGLLVLFSASGSDTNCLRIFVDDTSIGGLAVVTISNLKLDVRSDAPLGAVQVRVTDDCDCSLSLLDQTVSPAKVGTGIGGTASSRLGVTQIGAFTTSTKVAAVGKYITFRFDFGVGAAGQLVKIWGASKTGNDWSAFTAKTSRVANGSGVVYYSVRANSAAWSSFRAQWAGALTPARQGRWN